MHNAVLAQLHAWATRRPAVCENRSACKLHLEELARLMQSNAGCSSSFFVVEIWCTAIQDEDIVQVADDH